MLTRLVILALVAASALLVAPAASAQYGGPQQIQPTRSALWGELGIFTGSHQRSALGSLAGAEASATALSPMLEGYFGVTDSIEIAFQWGSVFVDRETTLAGLTEEDSSFLIGNPMISGVYLSHMDDAVLRLGMGVALPVADIDDDSAAGIVTRVIGYGLAAAMRGWWDSWLWAHDRLTVAVPQLRIDSKNHDFVWAVDAAMGLMIDTGDDDRDVEVPVQLAFEGGARLGSSFVLGARLQAVWVPTWDDDEADNLQLALEPLARVELENAFFYSKLTLNLDEPLGFAFDEGRVWGLHFGGGGRF